MTEIIKRYKKLLSEFVSFRSISTDSSFKPEIVKAVEWLSKLFTNEGFRIKLLTGKKCNPVLFAEFNNKSKETILIYGHYDVQPAEMNEGWDSEPFTMIEKENTLYARGILDNKGQILIHMLSVFKLIKEKQLGYNIKFLIEGNEETGNDDMREILEKNKKLLKSDYVVVSDGEVCQETPLIEASLRGGFSMKVVIETGNTDLHSGLYGGAVLNAGIVIANLVSKIIDEQNALKVPAFFYNVDEITITQIQNTGNLQSPLIQSLTLTQEENFYIKTALHPTIQLTGIKSGYTGEGFNNIVPGTAEARFNVRTVKSQNTDEVESTLKKYIVSCLPDSVTCKITVSGKHDPIKLNVESAIHRRAEKCLTKAFKTAPLTKYVGGAVPFVTDIQKVYDIDALLVPLGSDKNNAHGPNENYSLDIIKKGFLFSLDFFADDTTGNL